MAYILLKKEALFHNLETISNKVGAKERVAVVLKDNAYGHGLTTLAPLCAQFGIKRAVVRNLDEANKIVHLFDDILLLNEIPTTQTPYSITLNSLEDFTSIAHGSNVHLKVDTGMHRNGIDPQTLERAFKQICAKRLHLKGVFSHLRSADILSGETFWQLKNFEAIKEQSKILAKRYAMPTPLFHIANSSATFRLSDRHGDFIRTGIALYGYVDLDPAFAKPDLKPILELWAKKITTRTLKAKQKVGYGGGFEALDMLSSTTYDVGYGDGLFRFNEHHDVCTASGEKILGRVSMDSISVASDKEKICIFNDATLFAKAYGTISYDVLVKLNPTIPRSVV